MAKQKKEDGVVEDRTKFSLAQRREAARSDVFDLIKKKYGKGAVSYAGTAIPKTVPRISSGMFILDYALGGGWPRGRVNLLSGDRSTCKTTLLIKMLAQAQRMDIRTNKYIFEMPEDERESAVPYSCAFIDVEGVFDQSWAALQGVDVDALVYCRPDSQEEAGDIVEAMLQSKSVDIICVDSLAAMVPQSEIEGDMSDKDMGTAAKLNSKMFRKIQRAINASQRQIEDGVVPPTVFIINQLRCIDRSAMICTERGIIRADEVRTGDMIMSSSGTFKRVEGTHDSGIVSGSILQTHSSFPFFVSDNHIQPVIRDGCVLNVSGKDVVSGDFLILPDIHPCNREDFFCELTNHHPNMDELDSRVCDHQLPAQMTPLFAKFLGMWFADGYIGEYEKDHVVGFTEKDGDRYSLLLETCNAVFGDGVFGQVGGAIRCSSKKIVMFLRSIGCQSGAKQKTVPRCVLESGDTVIKHFLMGACFDSHGFSDIGFILTCESFEAARQINVMLRRFGVFPHCEFSRNGGCYFHITGHDAISYRDRIGFLEPRKTSESRAFIDSGNARGKYDIVPYLFGVNIFNSIREGKRVCSLPYYDGFNACRHGKLNFSRRRMIEMCEASGGGGVEFSKMLRSSRFEEVVCVEGAVVDSVDIEVDGDSLYVADGILTHNSKIGLVFGDPMIKPGGVAQDFFASTEVRLYGNKVVFFDEEKKVPKWGEFSFRVLKNKVSPPKIHGDYKLALGNDPDGAFTMGEVLDKKDLIEYADRLQMIGRKGAKWTFGGMEFDSKGQLMEYWMGQFRYDLMRRMVVERLCPRQ